MAQLQDRARLGRHQRDPHGGGGSGGRRVPGLRGAAGQQQQGGRALPEGVEAGGPGQNMGGKRM